MSSVNRIAVAVACAAMLTSGLAAAQSPKDFVMPYVANADGATGKGLVLVKASDFATGNFVGNTTAVVDPQVYRFGTPQGDTLVDYRPHTLIYGQAGKWRRASLRNGVKPSSAQVSSESLVAKRCLTSRLIPLDFKVENAAVLLYQLPGKDNKCGKGNDDLFRTVRITDAASKAPVTTKTQDLFLVQVYSTPGKLLAHFGVQRNKTLTHFNPALTATKNVLTKVTRFEPAGQTRGATLVAIVNGNLRRLQSNGTIDTSPLRTPETGFNISQAQVRDDLVYWVEQSRIDLQNPQAPTTSRIYRVAATGGAPVQMVSTNSAIQLQGFTTGRLLYTEGGGFSGTGVLPVLLKSIARTASAGAATATLHTETQGFLFVFSTSGNRVFFNTSSFSGTGVAQIARTVRDDASAPASQGNGSSWIGSQFESSPLGLDEESNLVGLLLARNGLENSTRGAKLFAVNPVSLVSSALPNATLAQNTTPSFAFAFGAAGLGFLNVESDSDGNSDVFAFDLVGKRYKRLTTNTPTSESPVF